MKRHIFKLTLLSDIVLHAKSATEGNLEVLDFIPGSNFLGIVAEDYDKFENPYDLFHSNKVKFGDAHISKNNKKSFKAPLSWFYNKGDSISDDLWIHHALNDKKREELILSGKQLKQVRNEWITQDYETIKINLNYALKSAYNRKYRRSEDGKMFGYNSFEAGSEWIFYLDVDEKIDAQKIIEKLKGKHFIGKSKTAQYGKVEINYIDSNFNSMSTDKLFKDETNEYLLIYAESRLAFFDKFGSPTLQPTPQHFKLDDNWKLDWSKTQIKHQVYAPYNFKNRNYHADRVCFKKGSVFVFKKLNNNAKFDISKIEEGVGEYQNEGLGNVILNPIFLQDDDAKIKTKIKTKNDKNDKKSTNQKLKKDSNNIIEKWLIHQRELEKKEKAIYENVKKFSDEYKNKFKKITASQWGQIRAIATEAKNFEELKKKLFKEVTTTSEDGKTRSEDRQNSGFLEHGQKAKDWNAGKSILEKNLDENKKFGTEYCVVLATQMQKISK